MTSQAAAAKANDQAVGEALRTIGVLFEPGDVIEIRALEVGRTYERGGDLHSGYFDFGNSEAISTAIRAVDGKAEGVYVVLNRLDPALLARSSNRLRIRPKAATSDLDIVERRWLYIDLDAERPSGISATDAEHAAALQRAAEIRAFLGERGWPEPVSGDSGNGGHLLYRLPPLELAQAGNLVKRCLQALSSRFSHSKVKVDESTSNAARLGKLYGTMARKGDSTPDRPHRRSAILDEPERIEPVPIAVLEALAAEAVVEAPPAKAPNRRPTAQSGLDIDQWLAHSDLEVVKGPEPYSGGRRWTLRSCPFNPAHEKPVVLELQNGALVFKCLHDSCSTHDWRALRSLIEPGYEERANTRYTADGRALQALTESSALDVPLITDLSQIPSVFSYDARLEWRVDEMIAAGSITLVCAESGTGKTWLGYHIAGCLAHGVPVLGRQAQQSQVLYLDGENPVYVVIQRLSDLGIADTPDLTVWGGWSPSPPVGPDDRLVVDFARQRQGLIVYDSLIEFHPGSEQSSTETRAFMRHFRRLANLGASVLVLHHTGKAETSKQYRGSSDIKAAVDTAYLLSRSSQQPDQLGQLSLHCFKSRLAPGRNFGMEFRKGCGFIPCEPQKLARTTEEIVTEILEANPDSNQNKILQLGHNLGCSKRQIIDCLQGGPWDKRPGPKNSTLFNVPTTGVAADEAGF